MDQNISQDDELGLSEAVVIDDDDDAVNQAKLNCNDEPPPATEIDEIKSIEPVPKPVNTIKGRNLSVTNPASRIPGIKRASNQLTLKRNNLTSSSQPSTPASNSKLSLTSRKDNDEKKTMKPPAANRFMKSPVSNAVSRNNSITSRGNNSTSKKFDNKSNLRKITSTAGDQNAPNGLDKNDSSVSDLKERLKKCMYDCFSKLKEYPQEGCGETHEPNILEGLLVLQDSTLKNVLELVDDFCKSYKYEPENRKQLVKMQKELKEYRQSLKLAETKIVDLSKKYEDDLSAMRNELKSKNQETISRKDTEIKELQKKLNMSEKQNDVLQTTLKSIENQDLNEIAKLREELQANQENLNTMAKKLNETEEILSLERGEAVQKTEIIKRLEFDLEEMRTNLDKQKTKFEAENNNSKLLEELAELRSVKNNLEQEKAGLESKCSQLLKETSKLEHLPKKLQEADEKIKLLQQQLNARENDSKSDCSKDVQMELAKLRQSEIEKRREIEKLKSELSKALFNITQLEEQIQRDQQLLQVRSDLINSLQTNETNQRIHLEELFVQVGEKNNTINELHSELRSKKEDCDSLYAKINAKQLELSNQEHMIKLLEESNERSQILRIKQEEKIGRMEEDIANLKQTIDIYQAGILNSNGQLNYAPTMPRSHNDCNENSYHYTSQRKRKRQIDINVKKYEV